MGIVDEDIRRVRDASDIVAVISQYTQLKRVGRRFSGLCPFHTEKTGSFSVNFEEGLYHCFGCKASGDVITFVREQEHLDFAGAVELLAGKAGIGLRYTDSNEGESRKHKRQITELVDKAAEWYHRRLLESPDAGAARQYLRSRGYDGEIVRAYKIGWAPDDWDVLAKNMKAPQKLLVESGLGFLNRRQRLQDFFRGRVLFPIFDANGDAVSFGGRILPGTENRGGKYINLTQTPVYDKSKTLYGLNWAKTDAVAADEVIICEGYTDVIGYGQAGVPRAVATCGTALTEDHVRMLKKFARRLVLSFDADAAGQAAADRFYEWEQKYEIDVVVARLPVGVDPGDLAREDPEALKAAVDDAVPFLGFRVERALAAGDQRSPEGRARTAEAALAVVDEHPSVTVRDQYMLQIAAQTRVEANLLRSASAHATGGGRPLAGGPQRAPIRVATNLTPHFATADPDAEHSALWLAIADPSEAASWFDEVLFGDPEYALAFRLLISGAGVHAALQSLDAATGELLIRLSVENSEITPVAAFVRLCQAATRREMEELTRRNFNARTGSDIERVPAALADANAVLFDDQTAPERQQEVGERLLEWLLSRGGSQ